MAVNNETGAVQPIQKIAAALEEQFKGKRKPRFHVDCVQALGKIPIDFLNDSGVDSAAFSAHKICGPRGIGLLLDACVASGLLGKDEDTYFNTEAGKLALVPGGPADLSKAIRYNQDVYPAWGRHAYPV